MKSYNQITLLDKISEMKTQLYHLENLYEKLLLEYPYPEGYDIPVFVNSCTIKIKGKYTTTYYTLNDKYQIETIDVYQHTEKPKDNIL